VPGTTRATLKQFSQISYSGAATPKRRTLMRRYQAFLMTALLVACVVNPSAGQNHANPKIPQNPAWSYEQFTDVTGKTILTADDVPRRAKIYGIAALRFTVTNAKASKSFYSKILEEDKPCVWCGDRRFMTYGIFYAYNDQQVVLDPYGILDQHAVAVDPQRRNMSNLLEKITFFTESVPAMRRYLQSQGVAVSPEIEDNPEGELQTIDPEGHVIAFMQKPCPEHKRNQDEPLMHIIHAGFIVHDASVENRFYRDILGFRLYWKGGMQDNETDWMDMQVPEGTDWIEYMLNVPDTADARTRGVMNHFAVGVPDIEQAAYRLAKNGIQLSEGPKIGRDGKWQLNLYDPDWTRVELMEFTPLQKPCCSAYTGPHPTL
jgi:catechol 2,3-dioxygenase-like lactoylglutathione lyase family enzyme